MYDEKTHAIYGTISTGGTSNAYFIICFTTQSIVIVSVTPLGKVGEILEVIPGDTVTEVVFDKGLFAYDLKIATDQADYEFNVNKMMIGTKWHKEELAKLLEETYSYKN